MLMPPDQQLLINFMQQHKKRELKFVSSLDNFKCYLSYSSTGVSWDCCLAASIAEAQAGQRVASS